MTCINFDLYYLEIPPFPKNPQKSSNKLDEYSSDFCWNYLSWDGKLAQNFYTLPKSSSWSLGTCRYVPCLVEMRLVINHYIYRVIFYFVRSTQVQTEMPDGNPSRMLPISTAFVTPVRLPQNFFRINLRDWQQLRFTYHYSSSNF